MKGAKMASIIVPSHPGWDCPWFQAEIALVYQISTKVLWWAKLTNVPAAELLYIIITAKNSNQKESLFELHAQRAVVNSCLTKMESVLEERTAMLLSKCLEPDTLLGAALGDARDWSRWHEHQPECLGSCNSEVEHLQRYTSDLAIFRRMEVSNG